jgi:hypothetical protein
MQEIGDNDITFMVKDLPRCRARSWMASHLGRLNIIAFGESA